MRRQTRFFLLFLAYSILLTDQLGFQVGNLFTLDVRRVVLLLAMLAVFVSNRRESTHRRHIGLSTLLLACYFLWAGIGVLSSTESRLSFVAYVAKLLFFLGVYLTTISLNLERAELDFFLRHLVIASTLAAIIVISEAVVRSTWYTQMLNLAHITITVDDTRYGTIRAMGPFSHSIGASMFLASAFFLAFGQYLRRKTKRLFVSSLIIAAAVLETYSRGGLVSGLVTFLLLAVLMRRWIKLSKLIFGILALILILGAFFPEAPRRLYVLAVGGLDPSLVTVREQTVTSAGNLQGRIQAAERVFSQFHEFALFGVGNGVTSLGDKALAFDETGRLSWLIDVVPLYATVAVEDGVPALVLFLLFLLTTLLYSYRLTKSHSPEISSFGIGFLGFVMVYAVSWLSMNSYPSPYVFFGICGMISTLYFTSRVEGELDNTSLS